jgi:hypothetical protein
MFGGALHEERSLFAQGRGEAERTHHVVDEPAVGRGSARDLDHAPSELGSCGPARITSARPSFARAAIRHGSVSGWPLFEGGTKDAEDDARR